MSVVSHWFSCLICWLVGGECFNSLFWPTYLWKEAFVSLHVPCQSRFQVCFGERWWPMGFSAGLLSGWSLLTCPGALGRSSPRAGLCTSPWCNPGDSPQAVSPARPDPSGWLHGLLLRQPLLPVWDPARPCEGTLCSVTQMVLEALLGDWTHF